MPLPDWFWNPESPEEMPSLLDDLPPPSFNRLWGLPNTGHPTHRMIVNRSYRLRVSWVVGKDNRLVVVNVTGRSKSADKVFALVVGWTDGTANTPLVRWLPLPPKLLETVRVVYKQPGMDPRTRDVILTKDRQGAWGWAECDDCLLANLREQEPGKYRNIEALILLTIDRWPGEGHRGLFDAPA